MVPPLDKEFGFYSRPSLFLGRMGGCVPPWGGEADMESFRPGSGGSVCDSSDIALSPLVISNSSSSAGAGCYGTDLAEASCTPFPNSSAHRSSRESAPGWGPSIAKIPFWPGRVWFSDLTSLLDGSPWGFLSGRLSSHWQRARSFTPTRSCGSCGCDPWGGTTHSLWSLYWGCWDHPPI